jgi:hypothetical protein
MTTDELKPGQRVRIVQTIDRRERDWHATVVGVVQAVELGKTGSWYAHAKDDKFWLRRIRLVKDDGEVTTINIDPCTQIELLSPAAGAAP